MKTGRKRKPTALKLIEGNPGNRRLNDNEPVAKPLYSPEPPAYLNDVEKAKWREVAAKLSACRVLTELDLDALELYVREWTALQLAIRDLNERGKMLQTPAGSVMWNPSWAQYKHSIRIVQRLQTEFGLTPSSRSGIVAAADETGKDPWANF